MSFKFWRLGGVMGLVAVLPIFFSSLILLFIYQQSWLFENPDWKLFTLFTLASAILVASALVPSTVVAILAGHFFQLWGLLSILIAYPVAAAIGLLLSRLLLRITGVKPFADVGDYREHLQALKKREWLFVAYLRLSPILPFAMMNILLATLPITWKNYIVGSLVGMLPRTLIFFWAGSKASEIWDFVRQPTLEGMIAVVRIALIFMALFGLGHMARQLIAEASAIKSAQSR